VAIVSETTWAWLYLLGVFAQALFAGRFLVQWLCSEWRQQSTVPLLFWQLSLCGHTIMMIHGCIQLQYHVSLVQVCSGVIAWRNIDLLGPRRLSLRKTLALILVIGVAVTVLFTWMAPAGLASWFQVPNVPWRASQGVLSWQWNAFGCAALLLFASRFWFQWWQAEQQQASNLGPVFWWITCASSSMLFIYFWQLGDPVNWFAPIVMLVPAVRNLIFLRRASLTTEVTHG
jgi:lipid-A-disaccharide synthase-like uncharacterized protein